MPHDAVSRRQFLHNVAASSTGAALGATLAGSPAAAGAAGAPEPPFPRTMESYPIAAPGKGAAPDRLKIVSMGTLPAPYAERIRAVAPGIELKAGLSERDVSRRTGGRARHLRPVRARRLRRRQAASLDPVASGRG